MACAVCGGYRGGEILDDNLEIMRSCVFCKGGQPVSYDLAVAALYAVTPEFIGGVQEVMDAVAQENN